MLSAYEVVVEDHDGLMSDLTLAGPRARMALRDLTNDVTHYAQRGMLLYVHGRLAAKIKRRHARQVAPHVVEGETGVTGYEQWPLYVHGGTGIYRLENPAPITVRHDRESASVISTRRGRRTLETGGAMRFFWHGKVTFRQMVRGQPANPYVERAYGQAKVYARARARRLGRQIFRPG